MTRLLPKSLPLTLSLMVALLGKAENELAGY